MRDSQLSTEASQINPNLAKRVQDELGQNVYLCYQCVKCSSGCPLSEFFDWQPNQVMRALQLGQEDIALGSKTPWLCAGCQTCTTRCPQGLDIAAIMDYLIRTALAQGRKPPVTEVKVFNEAFMREVHLWGRAFEVGLIAEMKLRTGDLFSDLDLAERLVRRNKIPFIPHLTRPSRNARRIAGASSAIAYYPGCSLDATSPEYNESSKATCKALGLNLIEPRGWVCCGSSAAHRVNPDEALRLPMQNLALIEQSGFKEVTMPCAACFNRHKAALYEIRHNPQRRKVVENAIAYSYQDQVRVNSLVETIYNHLSKEQLQARVVKPLQGLRVVCYYGCLLSRPPQVTEAENPENPTQMDEIMRGLGAEVIDWSYKTACCGASHSLSRPDIVIQLSQRLIQEARRSGADVIAVACPLCHINLDARQFQMNLPEAMPVLFFTQLMAIALGLPQAALLQKNLIDPRPVLLSRELL
jgi:heterodisulfide reductase subunit B